MSLEACVALVVGVVIGFIISGLVEAKMIDDSNFGTVILDLTDPEKDIISFEYTKNPERMIDEEQVVFDVKVAK